MSGPREARFKMKQALVVSATMHHRIFIFKLSYEVSSSASTDSIHESVEDTKLSTNKQHTLILLVLGPLKSLVC
jgi:hypothetical protein